LRTYRSIHGKHGTLLMKTDVPSSDTSASGSLMTLRKDVKKSLAAPTTASGPQPAASPPDCSTDWTLHAVFVLRLRPAWMGELKERFFSLLAACCAELPQRSLF
jgi:hypothetical protein